MNPNYNPGKNVVGGGEGNQKTLLLEGEGRGGDFLEQDMQLDCGLVMWKD